MSKVLRLGSFLVLASGIACADAIVLGGGDSLLTLPSTISNGAGCGMTINCGSSGVGPYWDNLSGDGSQKNVGYLLTATGGFSGGTNYNPVQYESQTNGAGNADAPTEIDLDHTSGSALLTLLANDTLDHTLSFGYYDASQTTAGAAAGTEQQIYGSGSMAGDIGVADPLNIPSDENYGFYVTRCTYTGNVCTGQVTWFSNEALDTGFDAGHQHFSIFTSPTTGIYYVAITDWMNGDSEGYGDFNDIVFELNTGSPPAPEPATLGLIGAGLFGIGMLRARTRRNGAATKKGSGLK